MEDKLVKISYYAKNCLLHKLSKDFYEKDSHAEYQVRKEKIKQNFPELISLLEHEKYPHESEIVSDTLSHLLILNFELRSEGSWNTEDSDCNNYSKQLNDTFKNTHGIKLDEILQSDQFEAQTIFDKAIKELHKCMTVDDFKKYPSLIEVYCLLIKDVQSYRVKLNPVRVLPVALLLIDDYITCNKVKGLKSCSAVLHNLSTEDFTAGNYFEVVYSSLKKNIVEKDIEVTQALFQCFLEFLKIVPADVKKTKLDDIFSSVVDQLLTESNLYKKADYLDFITKIIEMHGIHCVKKKVFKDILRDNIDICSEEGVSEIVLPHVLECLETWIKYCWCVWKLSANHKILTSLFKILYLSKDETTSQKLQNIITTLIKLCSKEEQIDILENLQEPLKCANKTFMERLETIKIQIST